MIIRAKSALVKRKRDKNTREKILNSARRVFAEKGYHQTRIIDLLKAGGVSPGAFYNYFSDKEELFMEIVFQAGELLRTTIQEIRHRGIKAGSQNEFFSVLVDSIQYFFRFVENNRTYFQILLGEQQNVNSRIAETLNAIIHDIHKDLRKDIERGIRLGFIWVSDPEITAFAILSAISGVALYYLNNPKIDRERLARSLAEMILIGLFRRTQDRPY